MEGPGAGSASWLPPPLVSPGWAARLLAGFCAGGGGRSACCSCTAMWSVLIRDRRVLVPLLTPHIMHCAATSHPTVDADEQIAIK